MSERDLKEAFVSHLNGTSLEEVALGSVLAPLCVINRGLILILYHQTKGTLQQSLPWISHFLLDFSVLVVPLILSCTVLSGVLHQVVISLTLIPACVLCFIYSTHNPSTWRRRNTVSTFLDSHIQINHVPFVTSFRVFVNVETAISILAVDFAVFPRRYAKTENYGTGVMDYGVGAFVLANALVCPEARMKSTSGSKVKHVTRQLLSVWPLLLLGVGRVVSMKMTGYHEHVTEYGVHWNFFFTLAVVRVAASVLLAVFPVSYSWVFAFLIGGFYQLALEASQLKAFIFSNSDRGKDFLHANKEGLFSIIGYLAIYMAGVQIGLYVMRQRSRVREWLRVTCSLFLGSLVFYAALWACQTLVEPVSRRLANVPFCLWSIAQSLYFMSCLSVIDMVLLFTKRVSGCHLVPSSWNLCEKQSDSEHKRSETENPCLIQVVSRNQLLFFLLANLMTGLTNSIVDTLNSTRVSSVCILMLYMSINCIVVYVLHLCKITIKFW
ncbi:phosphatidylinositol-glycan biosynthesis class W protein [Thalassophryne amazonica]|uniref:phosphatidylinositol-glycan biosynthesis class W protein n=1 Tax=Thalassophryne amazonica TaxID=390379 RepID=UPI001471EC9B|nr:phosphatidylinositol-glycan biosynthesis class W protein [Thalassophryne amazonica]